MLADHWIDRGDAERGMFIHASCDGLDAHVHALLAEHGLHWFEPLWRAGFAHDQLAFDRGFVRPLVLPAASSLLLEPSTFRMSPTVYRIDAKIESNTPVETWRATRLTVAADAGCVALRIAAPGYEPRRAVVRERSILERFSNPAIPRVLDVAQTATGIALVQVPFGAQLERRKHSEREVARIGRQIALALADLHAVDVHHGHIKRSSITWSPTGAVLGGMRSARCELPPIETEQRRVIKYYYEYLSPERVRGREWGAPADVWSLAMILNELVLGRLPLQRTEQNDFAALHAINTMAFDLPSGRFGDVLARALVREPEARPTAYELAWQLEAFA